MNSANLIIAISHISVGLLIALISWPLMNGKIEMNPTYGIRFQKAYESPENWDKINRYGAKKLIVWSVFTVLFGVIGLFIPMTLNGILFISLLLLPYLLIVIPFYQSWKFAQKL